MNPFFDSTSFPWHRSEATRLHTVLAQLVPHPDAIDRMYRRSAPDLPALALNASPSSIWSDVLENLTRAGALRQLLENVAEEFPNNQSAQSVIKAVQEATYVEPVLEHSFRSR